MMTRRTPDQLRARRAELDSIFDTAPSDQRAFITDLRSDQLTLDDATEILTEALIAQGDRRAWITEDWPHIVESVEIDRAFRLHLSTKPVARPTLDVEV